MSAKLDRLRAERDALRRVVRAALYVSRDGGVYPMLQETANLDEMLRDYPDSIDAMHEAMKNTAIGDLESYAPSDAGELDRLRAENERLRTEREA